MKRPIQRSSEGSNYVAEWFGHTVWPPSQVDDSPAAIAAQTNELCPFLSGAVGAPTRCSKTARYGSTVFPSGFCVQSSTSNGERHDWLACPNRILDADHTIVGNAIRVLYSLAPGQLITVDPVTKFHDPDFCQQRANELSTGSVRVFAFSSNPPLLGGEVDIPESDVASSSKVDVSIIELLLGDDALVPGRSAIFEVQTADFHGSPGHALNELRTLGPPTNDRNYHRAIRDNPELLGKDVEGPNKANIFKRMIYQMILKMKMATLSPADCAGCCVVIPLAVWVSWARHLGAPSLIPDPDRPDYAILRDTAETPCCSWIIVFDLDRESTRSPMPLKVSRIIGTDPETLTRLAFVEAPTKGVEQGAMVAYHEGIVARLSPKRKAAARSRTSPAPRTLFDESGEEQPARPHKYPRPRKPR